MPSLWLSRKIKILYLGSVLPPFFLLCMNKANIRNTSRLVSIMGLSELILLWDLWLSGPGQQIHSPPPLPGLILLLPDSFPPAIELRWSGTVGDWVLSR